MATLAATRFILPLIMFDLPLWVYVGFGAQFLWVASNLLDKYIIEKYFRSTEEAESGVGVLVLFSSLFALLISLLAYTVAPDDIQGGAKIAAIGLAVGFMNAIWLLLYLHAIENTELSRTIPIFQTIPIFAFVFAFLILGEALTSLQLLAGFIVILGAFSLTYHFSTRRFDIKPFLLMLAASSIIAFSDVLFKLTTIESNFWNTAFWMGIGFFTFGVFLYFSVATYRRQFNKFIVERNWQIWQANAGNEIVDTAANLVFIYAITLGPVALVQAMNAYQPAIVFLGGLIAAHVLPGVFPEETDTASVWQKILGITVIMVGSILLYQTL